MSPELQTAEPSIEDLTRTLFKYVHTARTKELDMFRRVLGSSAEEYLQSLGIPLQVFNVTSLVKAHDANAGSMNKLEKLGLVSAPYMRTDFVTLFGEHLVAINAWELVKPNVDLPAHVTQIDFLYLRDWVGNTKDSYSGQHSHGKTMSGEGMFTPALHFLRQMEGLVNAIDPNCVKQISYSDAQHYHIYRARFGKANNVKFGSPKGSRWS